jgi:hypothetical protein
MKKNTGKDLNKVMEEMEITEETLSNMSQLIDIERFKKDMREGNPYVGIKVGYDNTNSLDMKPLSNEGKEKIMQLAEKIFTKEEQQRHDDLLIRRDKLIGEIKTKLKVK